MLIFRKFFNFSFFFKLIAYYLNLIDSLLLDNNLFNSYNLSEDDVSKSEWLISGLTNEQTVTTCVCNIQIVGRSWNFWSKLQKEFSNLLHHFRIRITFFFIKIDHWDNKNLVVFVDSTNIFNMTFTDADEGNNQMCGAIQYPEAISPIDFVFLHNNSVLDVEITTDLDSNLGSW